MALPETETIFPGVVMGNISGISIGIETPNISTGYVETAEKIAFT